MINYNDRYCDKMEEEAMSPLDDCPESPESSESCEKQMIDIINSHQQNNHNSPVNGKKILGFVSNHKGNALKRIGFGDNLRKSVALSSDRYISF